VKTALVILNWNTKDYLRDFLPALIESCPAGAEVVVADSGSSDGSMEMMAAEFPTVKTIPLGANYGFTGGYNRALAQVEAEYYLLINSDILVEKGWIEPLLDWMEGHPECGICGPKLHALHRAEGGYEKSASFEYAGAAGGLLDRFGFPYCRGRIRSRVEPDNGQYDSPGSLLWVSGACLMIRSALWNALGGLDDRFFAHMEEIDLCWRAQLSGWKVQCVPASTVWHLGGGTLPQDSPWKLQLNFRNNLLLLDNNLIPTYLSKGMSEQKAGAKAGRMLRFRIFLDNCAKLIYRLTGKKEYAEAVSKAHSEFNELKGKARTNPASGAVVEGLTNKCILL